MPTSTRYERLGDPLVRSLHQHIAGGGNVLILSQRFGGKSLAFRKLRRELLREHGARLLNCALLQRPRIATEVAAVDAILKVAPPEMCLSGHNFAELFRSIRDYSIRIGDRVILLAADADGMEHQVLKGLLDSIHELVQCNQLAFALSAESNLRDLLEEVPGRLRVDEVMLTGYDRPEFDFYFTRWIERVQTRFANVDDTLKCCFEQTGGNLNTAVTFLKFALDRQIICDDAEPPPLTSRDVCQVAHLLASLGPGGSPLFMRAATMVASEPKCWPQLETLLKHDRVLPLGRDGRPDTLEFAGIAVRSGAELVFASPIMAAFARNHFDARRLGDFYASELNWHKAVNYYKTLSPDLRARPTDLQDRTAAAAVVNAVGARLNIDVAVSASTGFSLLRTSLEQASALLLDLPEVIFWHWTREGGWRSDPSSVEPWVVTNARSLLPDQPPFSEAHAEYPIQGTYAVGTLLSSVGEDALDAVTLSGFRRSRRLGPSRRRLSRMLLDHFAPAYALSAQITRERSEADLRLATSEAITSLYDLLFSGRPRFEQAIASVRARLMKPELRLSRFAVILTSDEGDLVSDCDGTNSVLLELCSNTEMHRGVLHSGSPERGELCIASSKAWLCLVPLDGKRLIHLERHDRPFTANEMRIFSEFARKLVIALEHGQKRSVLESAFRSIPEPLIISDSDQNIIYGNYAAQRSFGIFEGWSTQPRALESYPGLATLNQQVTRTLRERVPRVELYSGFRPPSTHALALTDCLADWQHREVGSLIHIQDQTYYHEMLDAFRRVSEAHTVKEALEATIGVFRQFGHEWIRFYAIEGNELVPRACADPSHPNAQAVFDAGTIRLPVRGADVLSWRCVFERRPVVFAYVTKTPRGEPVAHGETFYTERGIEVVADHDPLFRRELERRTGDMWMDCPLLLPDCEFGKFSLHCDERLTGERLVMLRVFSGMLATSIAVIQQHVQREHEVEEVAQDAVLDAVTHNLGSRLAVLGGFFGEYRKFEHTAPGLKTLNDRFRSQLEQILKLPGRAKDLARSDSVVRRPFELVSAVRRFFEVRLPPAAFTIEAREEVPVCADDARITDLLAELLANSQEFAEPSREMRVTVSIDLVCQGQVRLIYRDNGPGIPDQFKKRIFEISFSRRSGPASSGIGLCVVYNVVRAHGGTIEETGTFGKGAEFTIIMPIYSAPKARAEEPCSEYSSLKTISTP